MKNIAVICFLLLGYFAQAQHLPFQGKLLENSQPVNGTKTFYFSITNGGVNWNETQNVQVNNGLYAVVLGSVYALPTNLFAQQVPLNLVVHVNGSTLDTVSIYPPIEADPTVQVSVKDGVSWNEIQNLPTLDYSTTNELQNLTITGNELSISQGNSVTLNTNSVFTEPFTVGTVDTVAIMPIPPIPASPTPTSGTTIWQSFTTTSSGTLTAIKLNFGFLTQFTFSLTFYQSEGITGQQIGTTNNYNTNNYISTIQEQTLTLQAPLSLTCGTKYTFKILAGNSMYVSKSATDSYSGGISGGTSDLGASVDLIFNIEMTTLSPLTVFVNPSGDVGIGTGNPTAKLEITKSGCSTSGAILKVGNDQNPSIFQVNSDGNVVANKDGLNYYMVPAGGIIMWSGSIANIPSGWALCNGANGTPDLRDRFIIGAGNSYAVASTGGEAQHTLTVAEMPNHNHTVNNTTGYGWYQPGNTHGEGSYSNAYLIGPLNATGGGQPHNNLPPYYTLAYIMKLP